MEFSARTFIIGMFQILIIIANLTGNSLVLIVFIKVKSFRENLFNWYIASLATADLLISVDMTHSVIRWFYGRWPLGEIVCNVFFTVIYTAGLMSALMITVMSLDRYLCISKPIRYKLYGKSPKVRKFVAIGLVCTWIVVFSTYAILAFGWVAFTGKKDLDYSFECEMPFILNLSVNLIWIATQFLIPLMLLTYFNIQVFYKIKQQSKAVANRSFLAPSTNSTTTNDQTSATGSTLTNGIGTSTITTNNVGSVSERIATADRRNEASESSSKDVRVVSSFERRRKSVVLLAMYVVVFLICWIPFNVMILVATLCPTCSVSVNVYVACVYMLDINSLINPIIYTIRNPNFRQDVKSLFRKCC